MCANGECIQYHDAVFGPSCELKGRKMIKATKATFYGISAVALAFASPSFAQAAKDTKDTKAEAPASGDIIVTATRFETLASKTPIALTAISGDALRNAGITNPTALGDQVPSVMINRNNGLQITIRGVTSADGTEKGDPSAAFMSDGVYIARQQAQEVSFFDVSRVEVLRGPQGTLFGRNTTAGAVNVITNRPDLTRFSGSVDAAYGNYNNAQGTGVINAPVSENFGLRFAVNFDRRDSFLKAGTNFNAPLSPYKSNLGARLSALLKFDKGELLIRGDYTHLGGNGINTVSTGNYYTGYGAATALPGFTNATTLDTVSPVYIGNTLTNDQLRSLNATSADGITNQQFANNFKRDNASYGVGAEFKYDLGAVTLNYIGSYRKFDRTEGSYSYNTAGFAPNLFEGKYWQNSQELRLSTNGQGPVRAQVGLYYFKERADIQLFIYNRVLGGVRSAPGTLGYVFGFPQHYVLSQSKAAFGQVTFTPMPELRITGGIRYTSDKKARIGATVQCQFTNACAAVGDSISTNSASRNYSKTTWKVGFDYDVSAGTLLFGTVSTGYKAGGFNDGCETGTGVGCAQTAAALYYDPESLTSYEVGVKSRMFNNMLRFNLSAFHYDYSSLQLTQVGPFCAGLNCTVTRNATSAKVDGVELEGTFSATQNDRIDFSAAYLNARYSAFTPNAVTFPLVNWNGKKLDRSPSATFSLGYNHTFDMSNGGNVVAGVRTRYSSSYQISALAILGFFKQPSYTQTETTLTYNAPKKAYYVQVYAKNLENKFLVTAVGGGVNGTLQASDPRTFGVRAGMKF
jgi:iron complex outermembrane recepter protein